MLKELVEALEFNRDPEKANGMAAYMKNRFDFLGIPQPLRKELSRPFLKAALLLDMPAILQLAEELWKKPEREYQYIAMELLYASRKKWDAASELFFLHLVTEKSWWDTVDFIASKLIGTRFAGKKKPGIMNAWIGAENTWQNRTALLFQLNYKQNTDAEFLFTAVRCLLPKKEFFIQKAIGWSLRQYHRTAPDKVEEFVESAGITGLARKEALKHSS